MTDIPAADLARELNLPVAELLARADKIIGEVVQRDGIDAARGLTTRMQGSKVVLTPRLADALRQREKP